MQNILAVVLIGAGVTGSIAGDVFLKRGGFGDSTDFWIGMLLYGLTAVPAALALRRTSVGPFFIVWEALMVIAGTGLAWRVYDEPLSVMRLIAVFLAFAAVVLSYMS